MIYDWRIYNHGPAVVTDSKGKTYKNVEMVDTSSGMMLLSNLGRCNNTDYIVVPAPVTVKFLSKEAYDENDN